jgi:hypothetical protein
VILIDFVYFFVASSHKICGEEGSPFLWLLIVPTYDAHFQQPKLGPVQMCLRGTYFVASGDKFGS